MNFFDLTIEQINLLSNGCGGKGSIIKPPYAVFFTSTCYYHDVTYSQGGSEEDRLIADKGFLKAMLKDCDRLYGWKKLKYQTWAYLYYYAVRAFGWRYFIYRHEKITVEELLKEFEICTR